MAIKNFKLKIFGKNRNMFIILCSLSNTIFVDKHLKLEIYEIQ